MHLGLDPTNNQSSITSEKEVEQRMTYHIPETGANMEPVGQMGNGKTKRRVAQKNRDGCRTNRNEMERTGNECPKPCPVEKDG